MPSERTLKVLAEIEAAVAAGQKEIMPAFFQSWKGPSANVSAAFRMAKQSGMIEFARIGGDGKTVIYQPGGVAAAMAELAAGASVQ